MNQTLEDMMKNLPKELVRERKLPGGGVSKEIGPLIYGYSVTVGPDGKPVFREFGNVKPAQRTGVFGATRPALDVKEGREPLVDIIDEPEQVKVVAEIPGTEKEHIKTIAEPRILTISVDEGRKKYRKRLELPAEVNPESAKATYKNGVLEVLLTKRPERSEGKQIQVE